MALNIENLVNIIKDFGKLTADNLTTFDNKEQINIEFLKVKRDIEKFQNEFDECLENQIKINFDAKLFDLIFEELNAIETEFYVRYHKIRGSKKWDNYDLKTIAILQELEVKASSIFELISKLEVQKRYSNYLGSTEAKESETIQTIDSDNEKEWSLRKRYYLLEHLGIINILSERFKTYNDRHLIVSKILNVHHENVKKLHLNSYKGKPITPEEKKEVESYVKKFS